MPNSLSEETILAKFGGTSDAFNGGSGMKKP
jgi:hypothetical protein